MAEIERFLLRDREGYMGWSRGCPPQARPPGRPRHIRPAAEQGTAAGTVVLEAEAGTLQRLLSLVRVSSVAFGAAGPDRTGRFRLSSALLA
jgi:hypothetical protein